MKKNNTSFINEASEEIYLQTYKFHGDESRKADDDINDTHFRVAKDLAQHEENKEKITDDFLTILEDFSFMPGGRITSNAGTGLKGTTYINCFVDGFTGESQDSMEGILDTLRRQALILKSEGGYGFNSDVMRPKGAYIGGIGNESPGSVEMLDMWDTQSAVITKGSGKKSKKGKQKIRKGAQMVTKSVWHPDIEEYITVKQTENKLTKFNMSILCDDDFMNAVKHNKPWSLKFPDYENCKEIYNKEWDGNIRLWESKNYPVKIYKTYENANELWDLISKSTYNRNEPGVLFVDTINRLNNLWYCEYINATNPSLRKGTKVLTDNGIFNIEDLQDQKINIFNLNGEKSPAECFLSGRNKQLYKINFSNNKSIYCTKEHKWPVLMKGGGFAKTTTDNLRSGNLLPQNNKRKSLPFNNSDEKFNRENGLMLGWLYGDGWITNRSDNKQTQYGFIFNKNEKYIGEKILEIINKRKKEKSNLIQGDDGNYQIQVSSIEFDEFIKSFGVINKEDLPKSIWTSNDEFIGGFIDGIFSSDGYISKIDRSIQVVLTNKHENIIKNISELISFYGIKNNYSIQVSCNNKFPNKKEYNKEYIRYDLKINNNNCIEFASVFNLINKSKQEILNNIKTNIKKRTSDFGLLRIKSVEITDLYEDVWDISVYDETHCFEIGHCITGNCGEQILPIGGVCLLGSLNLAQFINDNREFDFEKFKNFIPKAVRMMDNVNDISYVPLDSQKVNLQNKRRIGLGVMGYGSALLMMGLKYGSEKALKFTDEVMSCLANTAYQASALLAKEKGAFPLYEEDKYLQSKFIQNVLSDETKSLIKKYGIRNSHLLSIQPTGNSSFFGNNVSGGGEPIFLFDYIRTAIQPFAPEGLDIPKNIDFSNKTYDSTTEWKWKKEGDENMLWTEFNGVIWKYDKNRGLLKEIKVEDYGVWWLRQRGLWDENADYSVNAYKLTVDDHVKTMEVLAKYLDSAMSKTINLPEDYPYEDFKSVYFKCWETGVIKGCTTYRDGTMAAVLSKASTTEINENEFHYHNAPKRPKELPCDVFKITAKGKKWTVIVGLYDDKPYECFGVEHDVTEIPENFKRGLLVKEGKGSYTLKNEKYTINDVTANMTDEEESLTRMISTALRHGSSIDFIVDQLNKSNGTVVSFNKAIARVLSKYAKELNESKKKCENCGSNNISYEEGCFKCYECGSSKCGS